MPHRCDLKNGYMTVFLSMVLLVITGFLLAVYGYIRTDAAKKDAEMRSAVAVRSILADYCRPLYESYGIFAIDGGYDTRKMNFEAAESRIREIVEDNDAILPYGAELLAPEKVDIMNAETLIDADYSKLKKVIAVYVKERLTVIRTKELLEEAAGLNSVMDEKDELTNRLEEGKAEEAVQDASDGPDLANMTPTERDYHLHETRRDPRRKVTSLGRKGLLKLVLPEGYRISDGAIALDCCYTLENGLDIPYIRNFSSYDDVKDTLNLFDGVFEAAEEELLVNEYIMGVAGNALENSDGPGLRYGTEFIIGGTESDSENLSRTAHRILLLRTALNVSHLLADPAKSGEAAASATALTWWCPPLQPGVYYLIITAWAYAEAVVDLRTLFGGGKVPVFKRADEWKLSFAGLLKLSYEEVSRLSCGSGRGPDYGDYLRIMLLAVPDGKKYARLAGLMEGNIRCREGYGNFCISNCITGVEASCSYHIDGFGGYKTEHAAAY